MVVIGVIMMTSGTSTEYGNGTFNVTEEPNFIAQGKEYDLFMGAYEMKLPVMLKGPTGTGKTRFVEYMAWKLGRPFYPDTGNEDMGASDLIGRYILRGGNTEWIDGPLLMAVKTGGLFYLDELVEARQDVLSVINSLTDHRRILPVSRLKRVWKAHDNFMFVASYNPGYQSVRKQPKPSLKQRFVTFNFDWAVPEVEKQILLAETDIDEERATHLVNLAGNIRNLKAEGLEEGISVRLLIYAAKYLASEREYDIESVLNATIVEPLTDNPDMKKTIRQHIQSIFDF